MLVEGFPKQRDVAKGVPVIGLIVPLVRIPPANVVVVVASVMALPEIEARPLVLRETLVEPLIAREPVACIETKVDLAIRESGDKVIFVPPEDRIT